MEEDGQALPEGLERFRSERLHFELSIPSGWLPLEDEASVTFREPNRPSGEPACTVTVAVAQVTDPDNFAGEVSQSLQLLLTDYLVLDELSDTDSGGGARYRSLGTYRQGLFSFTADHLGIVVDGTGYFISMVSETSAYPGIANLAEAVLGSFRTLAR